jgi:hypothetical protein
VGIDQLQQVDLAGVAPRPGQQRRDIEVGRAV